MFFHLLGVSFVLHFSLSLGTNKQGCCSLWYFFGTLFHSIVLQGWCNNLLPLFFNRNGRWRSEWSVSFQPSGGSVEVTGVLKVQVKETYYIVATNNSFWWVYKCPSFIWTEICKIIITSPKLDFQYIASILPITVCFHFFYLSVFP